MKATELRIGNWVRVQVMDTDTDGTIEGVGNLQLVEGQLWSIEELEPIPLTEEWLKRFDIQWKVSHNIKSAWSFWVTDEYNIDIEFVHELQNLHFALYNEELTLKELA